jgi:hypothetical protein
MFTYRYTKEIGGNLETSSYTNGLCRNGNEQEKLEKGQPHSCCHDAIM